MPDYHPGMIRWAKSIIFKSMQCSKEASHHDDERLKKLLTIELNSKTLDGRQLTHRRLETLMLVTGLNRKETIRLLREIGARPSGRFRAEIWTLRPKR
jgi:hypothetical protein